jgi:glycosyltransferase involved in cell wall biosynthesis
MDEVSVLIPAYQSESFIGRTLDCARAQTHPAIRILISVDKCGDATAAVAHARAAIDDRVVVFEQTERLGWAGNVNFLLDRSETPYHFLYFHDDMIAPTYIATLLTALRAQPQAASVHCDMSHFGGSDWYSTGRAYLGPAVERVLTFLLAPSRGSPLRSVMRKDAVGHCGCGSARAAASGPTSRS